MISTFYPNFLYILKSNLLRISYRCFNYNTTNFITRIHTSPSPPNFLVSLDVFIFTSELTWHPLSSYVYFSTIEFHVNKTVQHVTSLVHHDALCSHPCV